MKNRYREQIGGDQKAQTSKYKISHGEWNVQHGDYGYQLLLLSDPVMSDSLKPHGLQHTRPPCLSPSPGVCPISCSLHQQYFITNLIVSKRVDVKNSCHKKNNFEIIYGYSCYHDLCAIYTNIRSIHCTFKII